MHRGTTAKFMNAVDKYMEGGGSPKFILDMFDEENNIWRGVIGQFQYTYLHDIDQTALDAAARQAFPNVKPQTLIRQFYAPFTAVYNAGVRAGMCEKKEWRRPRVRRSDIQRKKWFSYGEAARFWVHAPEHLKAIFIFCIYTGARITEAIEMQRRDISPESRWGVLSATKTDNFRGVPLHPAIIRRFAASIAPHAHPTLFLTHSGQPYASKRNDYGLISGGGYFKRAWATTLRNAGMEGFTPYSMRHSLNNWLIMAGIDQTTREAIMGHDNGSTNAIYSDVPQSHLIEIINRLPDFTDFSRGYCKIHVVFTKYSAKYRKGNINKSLYYKDIGLRYIPW